MKRPRHTFWLLYAFQIPWWCGRRDSNPHGVTPNGFSYQLRLSPPPLRRLWSGLYLHRGERPASALGAARLVSTPSLSGLARGCHLTGFPDFEQFCVPGFPRAHSNDLQVRCVYHSATPAYSKRVAAPFAAVAV